MGFWIIGTGLALLCCAVLLRAVLRARASVQPAAAYDLRVYRDQLKEVDRDLARQVISPEDADRTRTEISRRILAADAQLQASSAQTGQPRPASFVLAGLAVVTVLGGSAWVYLQIGAPGYRDLPLAQRLAASDAARADRLTQAEAEARLPVPLPEEERGIDPEYLDLVKKLRATVATRPDDAQGLELLTRHEAGIGNMPAAHAAHARLLALKGAAATAAEYAVLADLMISAANGYVSSDAEAALRTALARDPADPFARYYLGLFMLQVDRPDTTFRLWRQLLEESQPGAPWTAPIMARLPEVAARAGVKYTLPERPGLNGPSDDDIAAAAEMSAEDRAEMIQGMVANLSARLATQGGPAEDWARLIRAHMVLGETDRAQAIYGEAQQVFANDPAALQALAAAANIQ